jgi:FAD:protein FMN transferase
MAHDSNRIGCLAAVVLVIGALWPAVSAAAPEEPPLRRFEFTEVHMAVDFQIILYAADEPTARQAAAAALARIKQIDQIMSDYDPHSELSRLSGAAPTSRGIAVSDDLWRVLARSQEASEKTGGAFDCTVGPIVRLWRRARRTGELPSADSIAAARQAVGFRFLEMDPEQHSVRLVKPEMRLDLGGIAKGYSVDAALAVLRDRGITRALVAGSGDIGVGDPPPGKKGWRIGVAPLELKGSPSRYVLLAKAAVSTSGDSMQHVEIGGKRYSHIVDPRTGMALTDHSSVTIVAENCTTTDALATGVSVLGPVAGLELIEKLPGTAAYIVRKPGDKVETYLSSGFRRFEDTTETDAAAK